MAPVWYRPFPAPLDLAAPSSNNPRWFTLGLRFFVVGAVVAAVAVLMLWLPQMRVLAAVALVQALLGIAVCSWGLRGSGAARSDEAATSFEPRPKGRWSHRRLAPMIEVRTGEPTMS